jgi:hypothetical protein
MSSPKKDDSHTLGIGRSAEAHSKTAWARWSRPSSRPSTLVGVDAAGITPSDAEVARFTPSG